MNRERGNEVSAVTKTSRNGFRFSDRFIKVATAILITFMLVCIVGGFILGPLSDNYEGQTADVLGMVAGVMIIGGIVLPLLVAAVLGGEAIKRGAGLIGFILIVGMLATAIALVPEVARGMSGAWPGVLLWGGVGLMALAVAGFLLVGFQAKVPMWLQLPILGSPRVYLSQPEQQHEQRSEQADEPKHRL